MGSEERAPGAGAGQEGERILQGQHGSWSHERGGRAGVRGGSSASGSIRAGVDTTLFLRGTHCALGPRTPCWEAVLVFYLKTLPLLRPLIVDLLNYSY